MKLIMGMNGFGRFGLHLLKYWLDRNETADFTIGYINDDTLSIQDAIRIMQSDRHVIFNKFKIQSSKDRLIILEPNGRLHEIVYTNRAAKDIPWLGEPHVLLECSGKFTVAKDCRMYLTQHTRLVMISATSWDADKTLVYGFNHGEFDATAHKVVSYGSCTVNAYVPFANYLQSKYGILESDVNVIHNIQAYRLEDNFTLNRKFCTLETSGQKLLPFLNPNNFLVNYTVVPYTGTSMIDFRFRTEKTLYKDEFIRDLEYAMASQPLKGLYEFSEIDVGPESFNCTTFSTVLIKSSVKVLNQNVYIQGYLDTENSVNRYFDLIQYLATHEALLSRWEDSSHDTKRKESHYL